MSDELVIGGKTFNSRLIVGTGRYRTMEEMVAAVEASGTEMITVAIRRLDLDDPTAKTLLDYIDWGRYQMLPNTAGCATVEEALFVARLGREVGQTNFVKLEVILTPNTCSPTAPLLWRRPDGWWMRVLSFCPTSTRTRCWPRTWKTPVAPR